jgi:Na+-transporting NADH:ubiquinone oxidoreductase subunit NqrC
MGTAHYFVYEFWPVVLLLLALSVVAAWLVSGSVYRIQWANIKSRYND